MSVVLRGDQSLGPYLVPYLQGGLGNVLFQVCSSFGLARKHGYQFGLNTEVKAATPAIHSKIDYFGADGFLGGLTSRYSTTTVPDRRFVEDAFFRPQSWAAVEDTAAGSITMEGYFQRPSHFERHWLELAQTLQWPVEKQPMLLQKYDALDKDTCFHVRGGDYRYLPLHAVDLRSYYKECYKTLDLDQTRHIYVATNDQSYVDYMLPWLTDMRYTLIEEDELNTLWLLKQCKGGIVGSNSSYAWWACFMNDVAPASKLMLPEQWFTDPRFDTSCYTSPRFTRL